MWKLPWIIFCSLHISSFHSPKDSVYFLSIVYVPMPCSEAMSSHKMYSWIVAFYFCENLQRSQASEVFLALQKEIIFAKYTNSLWTTTVTEIKTWLLLFSFCYLNFKVGEWEVYTIWSISARHNTIFLQQLVNWAEFKIYRQAL